MTIIITTAEELDALPHGVVVLSSAGTIACRFDERRGVVFGSDYPFPWESLQLPVTLLYNPDQPVSTAPIVEQIEAIILGHFHAPDYDRHESWWLEAQKAAKAIAALYPTCQPSPQAITRAIRDAVEAEHEGAGFEGPPHVNDWMEACDNMSMADSILALLPGRPEAEVKAEALQDAKAEIAALAASQPSQEAVAVEIERHGYDQSRDLGYDRSEVTCDCGSVLWWGEHDGDPSHDEVWYGHLMDAIREMLPGRPEAEVKAEALDDLVDMFGSSDSYPRETVQDWIKDRATGLRGER